MDRQAVIDVILRQIRLNIDGLDDTEIDLTRAMSSYGASSLDILEVVSSAKRELEIRVARTELVGLKNIGELVDLFVKIKNEKRNGK